MISTMLDLIVPILISAKARTVQVIISAVTMSGPNGCLKKNIGPEKRAVKKDSPNKLRTFPEYLWKIYIPLLDIPPEEQNWDMTIGGWRDDYGHTGASLFTFGFFKSKSLKIKLIKSVYSV